MLIWIRSFLVLQNYLVDPVRCIICTEDKPLQKCIYPNPVLVYFYCSPRAVDKQTWSAICDFESESLKNISIWVPLQLSERHNICETQSIVILYKVCHTKLNVIQSVLMYLSSEVKTSKTEHCTISIQEWTRALQTSVPSTALISPITNTYTIPLWWRPQHTPSKTM